MTGPKSETDDSAKNARKSTVKMQRLADALRDNLKRRKTGQRLAEKPPLDPVADKRGD